MERRPRSGKIAVLATASLVLMGAGSLAVAQTPPAPRDDPQGAPGEFLPNRVIVRYERGVDADQRREARADVGSVSARALDLARTELLRLPAGRSVTAAVADLQDDPGVEFAQPDWEYQLEALPNDVAFAQQWGLHNLGQAIQGSPGVPDADIDAPEAWDTTTGNQGVIVGVIDSGVNVQHPDLAPNIFVNPAEAGGAPGADDDGNGLVDDVNGYDFFNNESDVADDPEEHGTLVASVLGARGGNALGVSGVAQQVRILPLQARSASGGIATSAVINAVAYGRAMGARVINMSFGSFGPPDAGDEAIRAAIEGSPGILFSTSAGNRDPATNLPNNNDVKAHWPSNLTVTHANVIATANTTNTDALSGGSSFGATTVDLAAPGNDIVGARVTGRMFFENFDTTTAGTALPSGWTEIGGNWAVTGERFDSSPNSLTDSPGGNYAANSNTSATTPSIAVPGGASFCLEQHVRRRRTEAGFDHFFVELSVGGGAFTELQDLSGDSAGEGFLFSEDLFDTAAPTSVRLRFRLQADGSDNRDGVHVDDIEVRCGPTGENYQISSGTSFSSPMTAGVAALMLARNPNLDSAALKAGLRGSVDPVAGLAGRVSTAGRLNAEKAVRAAAPPPPPDTTPTTISRYSILPFSFLAMNRGAVIRSAARRGSVLRFRLSEPSRVRARILRARPGRRVGRRCVVPRRSNRRRRRCTRYVFAGSHSLPGTLTGAVRRTLTGRARGRKLSPATYRLELRATDAAGNRSRAYNKRFRILRPPKPRRRR